MIGHVTAFREDVDMPFLALKSHHPTRSSETNIPCSVLIRPVVSEEADVCSKDLMFCFLIRSIVSKEVLE